MYAFSKNEILELLNPQQKPLFDDVAISPFSTDAWLHHWIDQIARDDWNFYMPASSSLLRYQDPREPHILRSPSNYYTILSRALYRTEAHLVDTLNDMWQSSRISSIELRPLDAEDPMTSVFNEALVRSKWYMRRSIAFANWYLPCAGLSFDQYLSERSSQLRNTLKRKAKKFPGTIEICTGGDALERAIWDYQQVYLRSWKRPEPYPDFIPGWMRICAQRGWLRLAVARLDDIPIAAQFWFVHSGRAHVYKLAYDENHRNYSAGTLLTARLMQHVLDTDHVVEVDYGSGDDGYKRDWMTHRRERIVLTGCYLRTVRGKIRAAREWLGEATQPGRKRIAALRA